MRLTAQFPTDRGPQLLGTMAKHFGHKIEVKQTDTEAHIHFTAGIGSIALTENGLALAADAETLEDAKTVADVVERHLLRFAHREDPQPLAWT